jgi:hypothetical protein
LTKKETHGATLPIYRVDELAVCDKSTQMQFETYNIRCAHKVRVYWELSHGGGAKKEAEKKQARKDKKDLQKFFRNRKEKV